MYTVRFPFTTPSDRRIGEEPAQLQVGELNFALSYEGSFYALKVSGFATELQATLFIDQCRAAFAWLLLQRQIPVEADHRPQPIEYLEDPLQAGKNLAHSTGSKDFGPVHAVIDGAVPAIYLTDKAIKVVTGFQAGMRVTVPTSRALATIIEGIQHPTASAVNQDRKFEVALALYAAHFTENSAKAKFLTLVMAMEAQAIATLKAPAALLLLEEWRQHAQAALVNLPAGSEDAASVEALSRELLRRREDSIRSQVRKLVLGSLEHHLDVQHCAKRALAIYDLRSTLVHKGTIDAELLGRALEEARILVVRLLRSRYTKLAGLPPSDGS